MSDRDSSRCGPYSDAIPSEPAFTLGDGDRFYAILASDGIRYESDPAAETVIVFFVVTRSDGTFEVIQVMKTFRGQDCVSRTVQNKQGISAGRIDDEVDAIERTFSKGIEDATGYRITWYRLDLGRVQGRARQIACIKQWGRLTVKAELGGIGLN